MDEAKGEGPSLGSSDFLGFQVDVPVFFFFFFVEIRVLDLGFRV